MEAVNEAFRQAKTQNDLLRTALRERDDMTDRENKLTADVALLREALKGLMAWHLTDDHYANVGFVRCAAARAWAAAVAAMDATK